MATWRCSTRIGPIATRPYAVAQNTGAFVEVPDLLDSSHKVENAADAEAYLARLEAYAAALDGETGRLAHDAALGVVAPDFLLDKSLRQQRAVRATPIASWGLVASLARRTAAMPGGFGRRAEALVTEKVAPAMDRQIAELERHRARATADAGVWKLPDGEAYYAWALRAGTTSDADAGRGPQSGPRADCARFRREMDTLLRAQGLTRGTVGERMTALGEDPRQLFPNNDDGRRQLLAYHERPHRRHAHPPAPRLRHPGRRKPDRQAGAAGDRDRRARRLMPAPARSTAPCRATSTSTSTTSRPGRASASPPWPIHEGIPGHVWQGEYTYTLPLVRSLLAFNAYSEGWALYAEQLGDELGVYEDDPLGRLGYLQSIAFRACRLVVDTGLHAKRWTREHAIEWFATTNGSPVDDVTSEVDRYCAWPGQACGYKVGHSEINRLRDSARAALGATLRFPRVQRRLGDGRQRSPRRARPHHRRPCRGAAGLERSPPRLAEAPPDQVSRLRAAHLGAAIARAERGPAGPDALFPERPLPLAPLARARIAGQPVEAAGRKQQRKASDDDVPLLGFLHVAPPGGRIGLPASYRGRPDRGMSANGPLRTPPDRDIVRAMSSAGSAMAGKSIRGLSAIASALALAFAVPAAAGSTRWNMTPEQVAAAMGGQAPLDHGRRGERLGGKRIGNVGTHRLGNARFRSVYYYDGNGLAQIALNRTSGSCREIYAGIVRDHGPPVVTSDQMILRLFIWHDRASETRIRLIVSRSLCDLNYERLSDYEAFDLAHPTGR